MKFGVMERVWRREVERRGAQDTRRSRKVVVVEGPIHAGSKELRRGSMGVEGFENGRRRKNPLLEGRWFWVDGG